MSIVTCQLMGGLGNQLFQVFATIAYCIRYRRKFIFVYSEKICVGVERDAYWDTFLMHICTNREGGPTTQELCSLPLYMEKDFQYHAIPEWCSDFSFQLRGYFQSYLYFSEERARIFKMIRLSEQKKNVLQEYSELFVPGKMHISMHFRLGDYKYKQEFHPVLRFSYYFNALQHMQNYLCMDKVRVLYFCEKEDNDDVEEKIKNLSFPFEFVKVDDSISDWKQLLLMSLCDHHIIANSTFSWWGAYLNETNKMVCYPSVWFGPRLSHDVKHLFPASWTCIPCIS